MGDEERSAAGLAVGFAGRLRDAGLVVPPDAVITFAEALAALGFGLGEAYWAGRATLIRRPEDTEVFDREFARYFGVLAEPGGDLVERNALARKLEGEEAGHAQEGEGPAKPARYSRLEVLAEKDFASYDESEWEEARRLIDQLRLEPALRSSRRLRRSPAGAALDLPRTVRSALATDGEAVRRAWLARAARPRRVVFLVDVSGSMESYVRSFLRLCHAAVVARPPGSTEVFTIGTRLRRATKELAWRDPDAALAGVASLAADWYGGTRLGSGIREFNDRFGASGVARGSIVVLFSDGWDRGDPEELSDEMARLHRLAHRLLWVNPLSESPGYEPIARGMAAALPHVDEFLPGGSLASLSELASLMASSRQRRVDA